MPDISTSKTRKHEVSKGNLPQRSLLSLSFSTHSHMHTFLFYFAIDSPFNIAETKSHMPISMAKGAIKFGCFPKKFEGFIFFV